MWKQSKKRSALAGHLYRRRCGVDGTQKSMDAERYALRFSPRRPKSNWTETNKERARKLIAEGKMTGSGYASLPPDVKD